MSNCLSLSRDACPQDPDSAEYLLKYCDDYGYRVQSIMQTLPDKASMLYWRSYEFGDRQLYGSAVFEWLAGRPDCPNDVTRQLCQSNMRFFITDHSMEPLNLAGLWKNAVIIRFINSRHFQDTCLRLKTHDISSRDMYNGNYCQEKYNHLRGPSWPTWNDFDRQGYDIRQFPSLDYDIKEEISKFYRVHLLKNTVLLFDVDACYTSLDKFTCAVERLYHYLGLTDFQPRLVGDFYEKYMELHI